MSIRDSAIALRRKGRTYTEIAQALDGVSKSTLSYWLRDLPLTKAQEERISTNANLRAKIGRKQALLLRARKRKEYLDKLDAANRAILKEDFDMKTAKIVLSVLYLAEGSKNRRGSLTFGNSDPGIILLFMRLLRKCYPVDESKLRCTVQCRDGQDTNRLEQFWSKTTGIPSSQFYASRIDPRTKGKSLKHPEYKGVCRIDYFSANAYNDLAIMGLILTGR